MGLISQVLANKTQKLYHQPSTSCYSISLSSKKIDLHVKGWEENKNFTSPHRLIGLKRTIFWRVKNAAKFSYDDWECHIGIVATPVWDSCKAQVCPVGIVSLEKASSLGDASICQTPTCKQAARSSCLTLVLSVASVDILILQLEPCQRILLSMAF